MKSLSRHNHQPDEAFNALQHRVYNEISIATRVPIVQPIYSNLADHGEALIGM